MLIQKHIEIVRSSIPGLSSLSLVSAQAMQELLSRHYQQVHIATVDCVADLEALVLRHPDLVFMGMKFVPVNTLRGFQDPNKVWLASFLDDQGIAYTGSDHVAHRRELNKHLAKARVAKHGLKTAHYRVIKQTSAPLEVKLDLTFPVFIKPTDRGGGQGIDSQSVAHNFEQLEAKVQSISTQTKSDSLVEEYLPGREFSVAILKDELSNAFSVMPLELIAPLDQNGSRLLSAAVKVSDNERVIAVTDPVLGDQLSELALSSFHALEARDYGRIDIRLDTNGVPHFLEANLIPSLIDGYGNFPKACQLNQALDYETMLLRIVNLGLSRQTESLSLDDSLVDDLTLFNPLSAVEPLV